MNGETHEGGTSRVLLTMQNKDNIWRLSEIGLTFKMKLDGALIESFSTDEIHGRRSRRLDADCHPPTETPLRSMSARDLSANETAALDGLRQILAAKTQYRGANPNAGYSCDPARIERQ